MKTSNKRNKITVEGYTFTPDELDWARDNLASMRRTVQNNTVLYWTMIATFIVGLIAYFLADAMSTQTLLLPAGWRADLIADLLYNLGVTLWTSVVLVLFLEIVVEYQRKRWQRYIRLVERVLRDQGQEVPVEASNKADSEVMVRLNEIMNRLAIIDSLHAEVADLKAKLVSQTAK